MSTATNGLVNSLAAARLRACHKWPYVSTALLSLVPVESPGLGTMAVDAYWRLYYDPCVFSKWSVQETAGVLIHEVCHVIRNHSKRFANVLGFDPDQVLQAGCDPDTYANIKYLALIWNYAADCEINDDLEAGKIPLPKGILLPTQFNFPNGLLAEDYYSRLRQQLPPKPSQQKSKGGKGAGNGGSGDKQDIDDAGVPGTEAAGSGSDGIKRKWEAGKPNSKDGKGVDGLSEGQAELIRHEVARKVQAASKTQGNVPGGFRRWADGLLEPKVDYRRELACAVKQAIEQIKGHYDLTYSRLARKSPGNGLISPANVAPDIKIAVVIDTSGSMSDRCLGEAVGELSGILKALPRQDGVKVYACDAAVHTAQKCFRAEQVQLAGGGGTDMALAIRHASEVKPRPQLVICLTDGYTGWPEEPTCGVPCLAVIVSNGDDTAPDWIKSIKLPKNAFGEDDE